VDEDIDNLKEFDTQIRKSDDYDTSNEISENKDLKDFNLKNKLFIIYKKFIFKYENFKFHITLKIIKISNLIKFKKIKNGDNSSVIRIVEKKKCIGNTTIIIRKRKYIKIDLKDIISNDYDINSSSSFYFHSMKDKYSSANKWFQSNKLFDIDIKNIKIQRYLCNFTNFIKRK
jgi:hypothetical protein